MKKQSLIRVLMVVIIVTAAVFVVAAVRAKSPVTSEQCMQDKQDCMETKSQSEFLLESLTRNLLRR